MNFEIFIYNIINPYHWYPKISQRILKILPTILNGLDGKIGKKEKIYKIGRSTNSRCLFCLTRVMFLFWKCLRKDASLGHDYSVL